MDTVSHVTISNGSVTFHDPVEPGLMDLEASPAFFEVSFMLDAETETDGLKVRNIFHLRTRVGGLPESTPYSEVEAAAYAQLAPMLAGAARQAEMKRP